MCTPHPQKTETTNDAGTRRERRRGNFRKHVSSKRRIGFLFSHLSLFLTSLLLFFSSDWSARENCALVSALLFFLEEFMRNDSSDADPPSPYQTKPRRKVKTRRSNQRRLSVSSSPLPRRSSHTPQPDEPEPFPESREVEQLLEEFIFRPTREEILSVHFLPAEEAIKKLDEIRIVLRRAHRAVVATQKISDQDIERVWISKYISFAPIDTVKRLSNTVREIREEENLVDQQKRMIQSKFRDHEWQYRVNRNAELANRESEHRKQIVEEQQERARQRREELDRKRRDTIESSILRRGAIKNTMKSQSLEGKRYSMETNKTRKEGENDCDERKNLPCNTASYQNRSPSPSDLLFEYQKNGCQESSPSNRPRSHPSRSPLPNPRHRGLQFECPRATSDDQLSHHRPCSSIGSPSLRQPKISSLSTVSTVYRSKIPLKEYVPPIVQTSDPRDRIHRLRRMQYKEQNEKSLLRQGVSQSHSTDASAVHQPTEVLQSSSPFRPLLCQSDSSSSQQHQDRKSSSPIPHQNSYGKRAAIQDLLLQDPLMQVTQARPRPRLAAL